MREIFTYVWIYTYVRFVHRSFSGCGLLRNGREVTGQNLASTHCFVVFNGACTIRGMVQVASIGRARIRSFSRIATCVPVSRSVFVSPVLQGFTFPLSPSLSLIPLSLFLHPSFAAFRFVRNTREKWGEGRGGACTRSSLANQPIDTAVPLQVVNETALLRAASLSAIVRHCRIDVYRPLSRADNNI